MVIKLAKRYITELPLSQHPRWVVTCNFAKFLVYDMERPGGEPEEILLENLEKEYYRLQFLVDEGCEHLKREMEVSIAAGEMVGLLYDTTLRQIGSILQGHPDMKHIPGVDMSSGSLGQGVSAAVGMLW